MNRGELRGWPESGADHCNAHLRRMQALSSFEDVEEWDREARELIEATRAWTDIAGSVRHQLEKAHEAALAEHERKFFLIRWLTSPDRRAANRLHELESAEASLAYAVDGLEAGIDKTPDTKAERKAMVADLKLVRRELVMQKKEINASLRGARDVASVRLARVGTGFRGLLSSPTSRRYERMSIRLEKEAELEAHRDHREFIEHQILVIDRHILWLDKIR